MRLYEYSFTLSHLYNATNKWAKGPIIKYGQGGGVEKKLEGWDLNSFTSEIRVCEIFCL